MTIVSGFIAPAIPAATPSATKIAARAPVSIRRGSTSGSAGRRGLAGDERRSAARILTQPALVPLDRGAEAVLEARLRHEPERLAGAARIERAAGLAVGLRRVPDDLARVPRQPDDQLDQLADRDLPAHA